MSRITIDIDDKRSFLALKAAYNLMSLLKNAYIEIHVTRRGYHVIAFTSDVLTKEQIISIRRTLGDDSTRIELDNLSSLKPKQVLWTRKSGHENIRINADLFMRCSPS
jgi:hypothetical protein